MLEIPRLSLELSERLQPLRAALVEVGIPVSYLPSEPGRYATEDNAGAITLLIPRVTGAAGDQAWQVVTYRIFVKIALPRLYNDLAIDSSCVEVVADQICNLLCSFSPMGGTIAIRFEDYQLFEPDGDRWDATLTFNLSLLKSPNPPTEAAIKERLSVSLFNTTKTQDPTDASLVETFQRVE